MLGKEGGKRVQMGGMKFVLWHETGERSEEFRESSKEEDYGEVVTAELEQEVSKLRGKFSRMSDRAFEWL